MGSLAHWAGLAVHALTASGAVLGFLALLAASEDRFAAMFGWLAMALIIDAVDGTFARIANVKRTVPELSGDALDLVVDYTTYVLVPAYAMYRAGILPEVAALPAVAVILITAALYFGDIRMKTQDWHFRGFPAVWNLFAFLAFVLRPDPWLASVLVAVFAGLTFAPFAVVHPMRVTHLRPLSLTMLAASALLCALALWWDLAPPFAIKAGLVLASAYFLLIGFLRPSGRR